MKCPWCGDENSGSGDSRHQYLGQSDHSYLSVRLLGRRCTACKRDYTIEQVAEARHWTKPTPEDFTAELEFSEDK